ncbi:MAG: substrate-binding domain-containing protein [Micrococcales bacterium]|nr:substrate-binding domain-containing protein [Micrococcales bacterium]
MRRLSKVTAGVAALIAAASLAACSGGSGSPTTGSTAGATGGSTSSGQKTGLVVGVSNTVSGNGWRETMICSIKAQALASGQVSKVITVSKNGTASDQIQDMQNLISQGVNIIVVDPADPTKLNDVIKEATDRGITVVSVDSTVTAPTAFNVTNDQTKVGSLSMQWIADYLNGKGTFLYMRGTQGVSADTDRDNGVQSVLKNYPGITYKTVWSDWDYTKAGQQATQEFTATNYDAVWTSGQDYTVVNAIKAAGKPLVPVLGEDTNAFIEQLIQGDPGALVTNPAVVGGAGLAVGLQSINGKNPQKDTLLTPVLLDAKNNMDQLKAMYQPNADPTANVTVSIPGYTTYTAAQLSACKGPGE